MKFKSIEKPLFFLLFATTSSFLLSQNLVRLNNSKVEKVRIYQNGAFVSRSVNVNLNSGLNELVFDELSPFINVNSIAVKGTGDASIVGVNFQQNYLKNQKKSSEISKLESERDSLSQKLTFVQNKISASNEGLAVLQVNRLIGGTTNGMDVAKLSALVDYQVSKINSLKDGLIELGIKAQKIQDQISKINLQLNELNNKQNQAEGNIIVLVDAKTKSTANFEFSYLINSYVSWSPIYDVRVKNTSSPIEFILKAKVYQSTGEDWNDVKLTLNTGNPTDGSQKPILYPWYLNFIEYDHKIRGSRAGRFDDSITPQMIGVLETKKNKSEDLKWTETQIYENQLSNEYEILSKYTLKSGNAVTQIEINRTNANTYYEYASAPKLNSDAFLIGHVLNWESLNLLTAEGSVYFDGAYVGTCAIQNNISNDTMKISLGKDERITIKRTKLNELSGTNLFGNMKEKNISFEIVVKNTRKESIIISIEEQLPISQNKDIIVKTLELSGGKLNPTTGLVSWKISLKAGESSTKKFNFSVKYPKENKINGL